MSRLTIWTVFPLWLFLLPAVFAAGTLDLFLKPTRGESRSVFGVADLLRVDGVSTQAVRSLEFIFNSEKRVENLDPGHYRLRVHQQNGFVISPGVDLADGETGRLVFRMQVPALPILNIYPIHTDLPGTSVRDIVQCNDGYLWGTSPRGLLMMRSRVWGYGQFVGEPVYSMVKHPEKGVVITSPSGVFHVRDGRSSRNLFSNPFGNAEGRLQLAFRVEDGAMLVGGLSNVWIHAGSEAALNLPKDAPASTADPVDDLQLAWTRFSGPTGETTVALGVDIDGSFILATDQALHRWDETKQVFTPELQTPGLRPRAFCNDESGTAWVCATLDGASHLYRRHLGTWELVQILPGFAMPIGRSMAMKDGVCWMAHKPCVLRIEGERITCLPVNPVFQSGLGRRESPSSWEVKSLMLDGKNNLWTASRKGIASQEVGAGLVHRSFNGLPFNGVHSMEMDTSGRLWVAGGAWLARFDDGVWEVLPDLDAVPEPHRPSYQPNFTRSGSRLFLGSWQGLLEAVGDHLVHPETAPEGLKKPVIGQGALPDGSVWFATDEAMFLLRDGTWGTREFETPFGYQPRSIWMEQDETIWAAAHKGVGRWDGNRWEVVTDRMPAGLSKLWSITYNLETKRAYACSNLGVLQQHEGGWELYPRRDFVLGNRLRWTRESGLLISSQDGVLKQMRHVRALTPRHGLPSRRVFDVLPTEDGLWVATPKGLVQYLHGDRDLGAPKIKLLNNEAYATYPTRFGLTLEDPNALMADTAVYTLVLPASEPIADTDHPAWRRANSAKRFEWISPRPGKFRLHMFRGGFMGNDSEISHLEFELKPSAAQAMIRLRNRIVIGLSFLLLFAFLGLSFLGFRKIRREQNARSEAELASAAKTRFLADVSHELRTPLTAMIGHGDLLALSGKLDSDSRKSIDAIQYGGQHLLSVINNVIDISQVESGEKILHEESLSPLGLMNEIHSILGVSAQRKQVALVLMCDPNLPAAILSDPVMLRQALINLAGNAVKFIKAGTVTLEAKLIGNHIRFAVEDTGPGIPAAFRDRLYQPFERAREQSHNHPGTGLGLTLTRTFVNCLGAELKYNSQTKDEVADGKTGTRFWFDLPLRVAPPSETSGSPTTIFRAPEPEPNHEEPEEEAKLKLLIVEDEETNRILFSRFLAGSNLDIKTAEDGTEALALSAAWPADIVLMDIRLPDMTGTDVSHQLRARWPHSPWIVCVSADVYSLDKEDPESPFDDYLSKPIRARELVAYFDDLVEQFAENRP